MVLEENQGKEFSYDEELIPYRETGSMVLRLEHLLAGKSLDRMLAKAGTLYDLFLSYYIESLGYYETELANFISQKTDEDERQMQEYYYVKGLCDKEAKTLTNEEKEIVHRYYEDAVKQIETRQIKISLKPTKISLNYEHFMLEELKEREATLSVVQRSLKDIILPPRQVYLEGRIKEIVSQIEFLNDLKDNKICFAVNKDILFEHYDEIKQILYAAKKQGRKIELVIDDDGQKIEENTPKRRIPYAYKMEEMHKLGFLTKEFGAQLYFSEFYTENFMPYKRDELWSFKEVMLSNYRRHAFVESAKPLGFSPLEKIVATSEFITECQYTGEATPDEKTRTMLTAEKAKTAEGRTELKSKDRSFVCTSFASTAKATIDDFDDKNIECKLMNICYYDRETRKKKLTAVHAILLVHIDDDKYGTHGYYLWDPTWNAGNGGLTHCLFPVKDIEGYTGKGSIIDEELNLPKAALYLYAPRKEQVGKEENNDSFLSRYQEQSVPIKTTTYLSALKGMYEKAKQSRCFISNFRKKQIIDKSVDDLADETINTTLQNIGSFEPERATSDFYRQVCRYYIENSDEFADWREPDNWKKYIKTNTDYKKIIK